MGLRRELAVSLGLQGAGAASVLLATLWLGLRDGPWVQGGFSRAKSEIEFVAAFAMFGLPQALFFFVKSGRLSARSAHRWVGASAVLALVVGAGYALIEHRTASAFTAVTLATAVAAGVVHGQLRALLLVRERTVWFNVATALPQVVVLVGVGAAVVAGVAPQAPWFALFGLAFAVAAGLAWWRLARPAETPVAGEIGWRPLAHYGAAAWLTAALSTAAIVATQRWVESDQGRVGLGQFTMAMTLVQVPLTPISYAAPLLLRRWMEHSGSRASRRAGAAVFLGLVLLAAMVGAASGAWPDLGLGAAYAGATAALAWLLAGGAAEASSRVLTVQASAIGLPWIGVRAEVARWLTLLVGALALGRGVFPAHGVRAVCMVWAAAAAAAALVFAWHARERRERAPERRP